MAYRHSHPGDDEEAHMTQPQTKPATTRGGRTSRASRARYRYDLAGTVRVERLRLARRWWDEGASAQALAGYGEMLTRYAGSHAAHAAAEELLEMARMLER